MSRQPVSLQVPTTDLLNQPYLEMYCSGNHDNIEQVNGSVGGFLYLSGVKMASLTLLEFELIHL